PSHPRSPSVITVHDLAFLLYPRFLTRESARYYGQVDLAARRASQIIAVSQSTKRDIIKLLGVPPERVTVIYEASHPIFRQLDHDRAREHVAERYGITQDFILFVGTIEPRKNLPTLLQAFRRMLDVYHVDATLAIAGKPGWLTDQMNENVSSLNLNDKVHFLGPVPNEELVYLYNAARVFALPSYYEGFGLPPLEAMACGTPVVVSNTSSLPEVVGDAGQMVDPNDVEAWSVSLSRVLTDKDLRNEMCEKGLRRTASFSWERTAREHLAVYRQAAGK
ncbi:MAG: glycosyltransferase family 4 protein, partial [Rudaea sp.]